MRIPISDVTKYLDTQEMYGIIQRLLNEDEPVGHNIIGAGSTFFIEAFHDEDLDILWTVHKDYIKLADNVETKSLFTTLKSLDSSDG